MTDKAEQLKLARRRLASARRGLQRIKAEARRVASVPLSKGASLRTIEDLATIYLEGTRR